MGWVGWIGEGGAVTGWMGWRGQEALMGASSLWPQWGGPALLSQANPAHHACPAAPALPTSPAGPAPVPRWAPRRGRGDTCEAQRNHLTLSHGEGNCSLEREI